MTPRAGLVLSPGAFFMNKHGRGPKGDVTYQLSNLYAIRFQRRKILKMGFFVPMFQLVTPGAGPVLTSGASYMNKLGRGPQEDAIYQVPKL